MLGRVSTDVLESRVILSAMQKLGVQLHNDIHKIQAPDVLICPSSFDRYSVHLLIAHFCLYNE